MTASFFAHPTRKRFAGQGHDSSPLCVDGVVPAALGYLSATVSLMVSSV